MLIIFMILIPVILIWILDDQLIISTRLLETPLASLDSSWPASSLDLLGFAISFGALQNFNLLQSYQEHNFYCTMSRGLNYCPQFE